MSILYNIDLGDDIGVHRSKQKLVSWSVFGACSGQACYFTLFLLYFFLAYVEPKHFCFRAIKFSSADPTIQISAPGYLNNKIFVAIKFSSADPTIQISAPGYLNNKVFVS